jgi:hypothetical protein
VASWDDGADEHIQLSTEDRQDVGEMAALPNTVTIYIPLLDEGTIVCRPTDGIPLGDGLFRVQPTPNCYPKDEHWQFPPGSVVRCNVEVHGSGEILVARTLVQLT